MIHHYEGRYADMTSWQLLLEKMLLKPALYYILNCRTGRFVGDDIRKQFPNTTIERYDLPFGYLLLRPQMNVICVKE